MDGVQQMSCRYREREKEMGRGPSLCAGKAKDVRKRGRGPRIVGREDRRMKDRRPYLYFSLSLLISQEPWTKQLKEIGYCCTIASSPLSNFGIDRGALPKLYEDVARIVNYKPDRTSIQVNLASEASFCALLFGRISRGDPCSMMHSSDTSTISWC